MLRFVVNPAAGGGRARRHLAAIGRCAETLDASVELSTSGSDLRRRVRDAVEDGAQRIVVVGGDGTMHLAVQELSNTTSELAILPTGRGNDLAASLDVPLGFEAALDLAIGGTGRLVDLGRVGDELFAFYAGVGFDSAASATADGHPRWWPDSITYIIAALRTLIGFVAPTARIEFDDGSFEGEVMFATACNGPRFGGGMLIAPEACMDDALLDLVIVRKLSKLELLKIFPSVYRGEHVGSSAVSIHRTRRVRVALEPPMLLGSDGEVLGEVGAEPIEMEIVPKALCVVAGAGTVE